MDFSFIHVADIHLGRPFSGLSKFSCDENSMNLYKNAVEQSLENMVNYAISKDVDFVFIAGDTFDSGEADFSSKLILKNALKRLMDANISVFVIAGNHDPISAYSKNTFNYDENSKVKIIGLNTESITKLQLINKKNELVGYLHALSFNDTKYISNPLEKFSTPNEKLFDIGLLHCDLNADSSSNYAPCSLSEMLAKNYNYWALGHIHLPNLDNSNIQYSGTIQGRNTKETGKHGVRYVKVANNNIIENSFVPMDIIRYEDVCIDLSSVSDLTDALYLIEEEINTLINKEKDYCQIYLIRLKLTGCISFCSEINEEFYETISNRLSSNFSKKIYLSQTENALTPKVDSELLQNDDGIAGELYRLVCNDNNIKDVYMQVITQLKNIKVNEENINYILNSVRENGINLSSLIYNDINEE